MKMSSKIMKFVLPQNFQETVITHEMKYDKGDKNVNLIRNLLYLYSIGIEYYDSVNNTKLFNYFQEKSLKLLIDEEVIGILEKDKNQNKYLKSNRKIDLFCEDMLKICEKEENIPIAISNTDGNVYVHSESSLFDCQDKTNATYNLTGESTNCSDNSPKKSKIKRSSLNNLYGTEPRHCSNLLEKEFEIDKSNIIHQFKSRVIKVEEKLNNDISSQSEMFQLLKTKKIKEQSLKRLKNKPFIKRKESTLKACINPNNEDTMIILNNIMELSEKKLLCVQKQMQFEIEAFINGNLEEMYKSIDELKLTFEKEIKVMEENGLSIVVKSLEEDMKNETENLKEQYEELRRNGIEKINLKYKLLMK